MVAEETWFGLILYLVTLIIGLKFKKEIIGISGLIGIVLGWSMMAVMGYYSLILIFFSLGLIGYGFWPEEGKGKGK